MEAHKERMVIELKELDEKITKLSQFILKEEFSDSSKLTGEETSLLVDQLTTMEEYIIVLLRRITISFSDYEYNTSGIQEIMDKYRIGFIKRFV